MAHPGDVPGEESQYDTDYPDLFGESDAYVGDPDEDEGEHGVPEPESAPNPSRIARLRSRARPGSFFAFGVIAALVAVALYGALVHGPAPLSQGDVAKQIKQALASVTPPPAFSEAVYQAIEPSLVSVQADMPSTTALGGGGVVATAVPRPSGGGGADPSSGPLRQTGSGFIVTDTGAVMTALHVVAGSTAIQLTFADGSTSPATVASSDPAHDIAVLQPATPPGQIVAAVIGSSRNVKVGSEVYVVGNPLGLTRSITAGVVSGIDRSFELPDGGRTITGLIQVDAAVNPGNSGGPLLNRNGEVVGVVDALVNPTKQDVFIGIGLAVPIETAAGGAGLPQD